MHVPDRRARTLVSLTLTACLALSLLATPAEAATRSRFFQFNASGSKEHRGEHGVVVPAVVRSLKDFRPQAASLNEICRSQFRAIRRRVARGENKWVMRGRWVQTKGRANNCRGDHFGNGVLTRNPISAKRVWRLPNTGQVESRKLLCARTKVRRRTTWACTTHIVPRNLGPNRRQIRKVARTLNPWVAGGRRVVLMGDFNATPTESRLDRIYSARYPDGRGRFKEVDGPNGCRCGEATHESRRKIDYVFVSARHFRRVRGNATQTTTDSDHVPLRGSAVLAR